MIKLNKQDEPAILILNSKYWTDTVVEKIQKNEKPTKTESSRYGHSEIKATLLVETFGKCAYCESKIRHVSYGDIEHVVPKKADPSLWFTWENLTLACDVCNTNKGTHIDLVDPYEGNPEDRFIFMGSYMWPVFGDDQAFLTRRILDLNREALQGRRAEELEKLWTLLQLIKMTINPVIKNVLASDFKNNELGDEKEYAALRRMVAREAVRVGILT